MDVVVPAGVAVIGVFIAWKVLSGLVKMVAMLAVVGLAAYLYFGGAV